MKEIALAFVSAQKEFGVAHKSSDNPFFKSKYADLSTVIEAVMTALHNNDIALIQNCHESNTGVVVETIFIHKSGETISAGKLSVPAAKNDPQGYGSALTYARRYSLMAACGIAPEDDDGNSAVKAMPSKFSIELKNAAMNGTKELTEYHLNNNKKQGYKEVWELEGKLLKDAAELADKPLIKINLKDVLA